LPNAAYAVTCASINARNLSDDTRARRGPSALQAVAARVEAKTAAPGWSKARRLILVVVTAPIRFILGISDLANITGTVARWLAHSCQDG
jgi:hypothetical protein